MQLADKSGIACDTCGMQYKQDFGYYSLDFKQVLVVNNRVPSLDMILGLKTAHSIDMCASCYDKMKEKIVFNYAAKMDKPKTNCCELSNKPLFGNYTYYYCVVAEVIVKMTGQASVCIKCKSTTLDTKNKCGKCGGGEFLKPASVKANHRTLEFGICDTEMTNLLSQTKKIKESPVSSWTTRT